MDEHLPAKLIPKLVNLSQAAASPYAIHSNSVNEADQSQVEERVAGLSIDTPEHRMEDCKKNLFKNAADSYSIDLLSEEEFSRIPKYMIGRQSLATLNDFVTTINQILDSKYSLLAIGKNGARKKGKLDLYLSLKREEIVVAPGEGTILYIAGTTGIETLL